MYTLHKLNVPNYLELPLTADRMKDLDYGKVFNVVASRILSDKKQSLSEIKCYKKIKLKLFFRIIIVAFSQNDYLTLYQILQSR